ncbi:MAG: hypothetical protein FD131_3010 [Rhodocyclaceae bacterium]|nr:MAG: hypothetical protein FD131_3010 [Rhodocyclaceae bacterium]
MERVILVLAMLAEGMKVFFNRIPERLVTPDLVEEKTTDWRQYDIPAYMRRNGIEADSGKNGDASFEVIA